MLQYQPNQLLNELIQRLHQSIAVDKVFLLGVMAEGHPVNSIFRPGDQGAVPPSGYILLLLTRPGERRSDGEVQDMLEQQNRQFLPISLMVYPVKNFYQWLGNGQPFALQVIRQAPVLYDSCITMIPPAAFTLKEQYEEKLKKMIDRGYRRSTEFLAGAQLFALRMENHLAAFLLHQATEHACLAFLLQYTGLRTGTHNLDKLLRYTTLISNDLTEIFSRQSESDIELFRVLQKAYIHSRYKDDFEVSAVQLAALVRRVMQLLFCVCPEILAERFSLWPPNTNGISMVCEEEVQYAVKKVQAAPAFPAHFSIRRSKRKIRKSLSIRLPDHFGLAPDWQKEMAALLCLENQDQQQNNNQYCTY